MASACAVAATPARCSGVRSGVHRTIRRATPSSSISASAVGNCSRVAMSTERPRSDSSADPKVDPALNCSSATKAPRPWNLPLTAAPDGAMKSHRELTSGFFLIPLKAKSMATRGSGTKNCVIDIANTNHSR